MSAGQIASEIYRDSAGLHGEDVGVLTIEASVSLWPTKNSPPAPNGNDGTCPSGCVAAAGRWGRRRKHYSYVRTKKEETADDASDDEEEEYAGQRSSLMRDEFLGQSAR